jgi:tetratricopeptide (TPR) repeat protein
MYGHFLEVGEIKHMKNLLINENNINQRINKKIYNIKAEKLVREAHDNFLYFKDYEMAVEQAEEVLEIDPLNAQAIILKGNIFFCVDEKDRALKCFEEALEIDPYSAEAYSLKANILDMRGQEEEALECCEKAFQNLRKRDRELLTSLYDQKIAILVKLKKYEEAKETLKKSYKHLGEEDSSYIASCYRDVIDTLHRAKQKKKSIAVKRLKLVHSP